MPDSAPVHQAPKLRQTGLMNVKSATTLAARYREKCIHIGVLRRKRGDKTDHGPRCTIAAFGPGMKRRPGRSEPVDGSYRQTDKNLVCFHRARKLSALETAKALRSTCSHRICMTREAA